MKIKKLLIINVLLFLLLFVSCEFVTYKQVVSSYQTNGSQKFSFFYSYLTDTKKNFIETYKQIEKNQINAIESGFRITSDLNTHSKKPSIFLFGCSYTYGAWLRNDETFSYKLQNYTNRLVFNRAFSGWGIQHMLFQLKRKDFSSSFIGINNNSFNYNSDVEYVIFTFISDHVRRLYMPCDFFDDKVMLYRLQNSSLKEKSNLDNIFWHSYILRNLSRKILRKKVDSFDNSVQNLILSHFIECQKLSKENFPNSKFVLFVYDGDSYIKTIEQRLLDSGIIVVYLSELTDIDFTQNKFQVDDVGHPSKYAWDVIVPLLSKKLNL